MNSDNKFVKYLKWSEYIVFIGVFCYTFYSLVYGFSIYSWSTIDSIFSWPKIEGKEGFVVDFWKPVISKEYYKSIVAIIWVVVSVFTIWEILVLFFQISKRETKGEWNFEKIKRIYIEVFKRYKDTFFAGLLLGFIPLLIKLDFIWDLMPIFKRFALFSINFKWYSWIYALLIWDLTTWIWHYGAHKVRLFWCLHSPHHAPTEMNMTVAWVHFFAEGFYSVVIQAFIVMLLGVHTEMIVVIMMFEVSWGTLIHAGERSLKNGKLGFLHHMVMTPSHHRVHHASNPLYLDTNFCTLLPFWDWLFGTLQPLREEIDIRYGISREIETFPDFYFGEILLLFLDIKKEKNLSNEFLYLIKPPGWSPKETETHTTTKIRGSFLQENGTLALTSKDYLLLSLKKIMPKYGILKKQNEIIE